MIIKVNQKKKPVVKKYSTIIITIHSLGMRYFELKKMLNSHKINFENERSWTEIYDKLEREIPMYVRITKRPDGTIKMGYSDLRYLEELDPDDEMLKGAIIYNLSDIITLL